MTILIKNISVSTATSSALKQIGNVWVAPASADYHPAIVKATTNTISTPGSSPQTIDRITTSAGVSNSTIRDLQHQLQQPPQNMPPVASSTATLPSLPQPTTTASPTVSNPITIANSAPQTQPQASVNDPVYAPNDEIWNGPTLSDADKPKILGIVSKNITNGIPQKNLIFIQGMNSVDKKATLYSILKKEIFSGANFVKIFESAPNDITLPQEYFTTISENPSMASASFAVEDNEIHNNGVYIYKLYMEWAPKTTDEIQQTLVSALTNKASQQQLLSNIGNFIPK